MLTLTDITGDHVDSSVIHFGALQCVTQANMLNYYSALGIRNLVNNEDKDKVMAMVDEKTVCQQQQQQQQQQQHGVE